MSSPTFVSLTCLLRGLPLFFSAAPRTPLRVLGIIAFNTLHVLRHSRRLTRTRIGELALFLDLEGCANAEWDHKNLSAAEYGAIRQRLEQAGLGLRMDDYLSRLHDLESRRPPIGEGQRHFADVRSYREDVVRLSIATAAAIALNASLDDALEATWADPDIAALFRVLMQCQIIDDVVDYKEDVARGLPSFLTASASLPETMRLTAAAARSYSLGDRHTAFPLRVVLAVVSAVARLFVGVLGPARRPGQK